MIICNKCKRLFKDKEVVLVSEDPSPSGISLPPGEILSAYCPYCGNDDIDFDYHMVDELDVDEGRDETEAIISYRGKRLLLSVDDDGELRFGWLGKAPEKPSRQKSEERVTA